MTPDTRQQLQLRQPYLHHGRSLSPARAGRGTARQFLSTMTGLGPDDGYDWLQRIGRTRVARRWAEHAVARARPAFASRT